ncbi:UPF0262 family protein [Caenispirillum bisanense]|uniref:UPF0262 protein SAMN05421508_11819 n=1 Tax=Caenispirillum bisanense TaxID=414052 RepID=A0A286H0S5_9PROT|nr:UPF0262 family protein [Caenispirillum bisanense]SOE01398.1 Uncharacterized protein, UPF0262 family [Caenispirillum bisanense]
MAGGAARKDVIVNVVLDERTLVRRRPEVEHERAVAIYDLLEENVFRLKDAAISGPYVLHLSLSDNRLVMDIRDTAEQPLTRITLPLTPFRGIVRDYFMVCESYYGAIKTASPSQIEAIDMGRRGLHNEGAELMRERLADQVEIDVDTSRRLFTLLCVLHIRG